MVPKPDYFLAPFEEPICAQVAQSVEQWTENPRVGGSIPSLGTSFSASIGCEIIPHLQ